VTELPWSRRLLIDKRRDTSDRDAPVSPFGSVRLNFQILLSVPLCDQVLWGDLKLFRESNRNGFSATVGQG
jgi:hypothetical protein